MLFSIIQTFFASSNAAYHGNRYFQFQSRCIICAPPPPKKRKKKESRLWVCSRRQIHIVHTLLYNHSATPNANSVSCFWKTMLFSSSLQTSAIYMELCLVQCSDVLPAPGVIGEVWRSGTPSAFFPEPQLCDRGGGLGCSLPGLLLWLTCSCVSCTVIRQE